MSPVATCAKKTGPWPEPPGVAQKYISHTNPLVIKSWHAKFHSEQSNILVRSLLTPIWTSSLTSWKITSMLGPLVTWARLSSCSSPTKSLYICHERIVSKSRRTLHFKSRSLSLSRIFSHGLASKIPTFYRCNPERVRQKHAPWPE